VDLAVNFGGALPSASFYQRHLSSLKGFFCAYRVHTGHCSCSALGFRAIRRYGVSRGIGALRRRMYLCGVAHRHSGATSRLPTTARLQAGFVDLDCGAPDASRCDGAGAMNVLDVSHCSEAVNWFDAWSCSGGYDLPDSGRKNRGNERYVHIPPNSNAVLPRWSPTSSPQ